MTPSTRRTSDRGGVLGVVVLFHPPDAVIGALRALLPQVDRLLVVDNTPAPELTVSRVFPDEPPAVRWLALRENTGIAHALAVALETAAAEEREWMVSFDQDTAIEEEYVVRMLDAAARWEGTPAALLAPALPGDRGRPGLAEVARAITSGALARVAALRGVGGFREDLFIDYVDFELCLRLRRAGHAIVRNGDVVLGHRIGAPVVRRLFGREVTTTNHPPVRRYYKCRNRVAVVRDHFAVAPLWLAREVLATFWEAGKIVLLEERRREKLRMMARGIADGISGRMGPYAPDPRSSSR